MKRSLIALGTVLLIALSASPVAATSSEGENGSSDHKFSWLFHGDSTVTQTNSNESGNAKALNANWTDQSNDQKQVGIGGEATSGDASSSGGGSDWSPGCGQSKPKAHEYEKNGAPCGKKENHGPDAASGDAYGGDVSQSQQASNSNQTEQSAYAESKAKQVAPLNVNESKGFLWWGDSTVDQSNTNSAGDATAVNKNSTDQSNDQAQFGLGGNATSGSATSDNGDCGCDAKHGGGDAESGKAVGGDVDQYQAAENYNATRQEASAESTAVQIAPINVNAPIRILSPGDDSVNQSNTNESGDATAINHNDTDQSNDQKQLGIGGDATSGDASSSGGDAETGDAYGGDVSQSQQASNSNETSQGAYAESTAKQIAPINVNAPIRILSWGSDDVSQTNSNSSGDATAVNANSTDQSNDQAQYGFGGNAESGDATSDGGDCGCYGGGDAESGKAIGGDVDQSQQAANSNATSQSAEASSSAAQIAPANLNLGGLPVLLH